MPVTQTIGPIIARQGETNLVAKLRTAPESTVVATSATLAAATGSPIAYLPVFTDVAAGEYFCELLDSDENVLTVGWVVLADAGATYAIYGEQTGDRANVGVTLLLERVTTTVVTLWANLTAMITGSGGSAAWTAVSMDNAPSGGGGDTSEQLTRIEEKTNLITTGKINIVSPVTPGGDITLTKGSDYRVRSGTAIQVAISDAGAVLHAKLRDILQVKTIIFGAGRRGEANQITGTVDASTIAEANGTTTISIEVTAEQMSSASVSDDYTYHIKGIAPVVASEVAGDEAVQISGCLELLNERAAP